MSDKTLGVEVRQQAAARVEVERASVEGYVITANITLLAAFVFLVATDSNGEGSVAVFAVGALVCLVTSLGLMLWHKVRFPLRQMQLDVGGADLTYKYTDKILAFNETFLQSSPEVRRQISEGKKQVASGDDPSTQAYLQARDVLESYLRNLGEESQRLRVRVLTKPLPEKHGRILHALDRLAKRFRLWVFTLGVALMVAAVVMRLLGY